MLRYNNNVWSNAFYLRQPRPPNDFHSLIQSVNYSKLSITQTTMLATISILATFIASGLAARWVLDVLYHSETARWCIVLSCHYVSIHLHPSSSQSLISSSHITSSQRAQVFTPPSTSPTTQSGNYTGSSNGTLINSPYVRGAAFDRFIIMCVASASIKRVLGDYFLTWSDKS